MVTESPEPENALNEKYPLMYRSVVSQTVMLIEPEDAVYVYEPAEKRPPASG